MLLPPPVVLIVEQAAACQPGWLASDPASYHVLGVTLRTCNAQASAPSLMCYGRT